MQKTISIFNPMQNASKTTTAYLLANALSHRGRVKTCLIDADTVNDKKRSGNYYLKRPGLPKPFECHSSEGWDALSPTEQASFDYVVVDTQKNPANGLVQAIGRESDLIIIPSPPNDGAWTDGAKPAIDMIREVNDKAPMAFIIASFQSSDSEKFESRADGADVPIIGEIPELDVDECIGRGWLPQYADASQRRWTRIESIFSGLAKTIVEDVL